MPDPQNMEDAIRQVSMEPKQISGDQGSVTNQDIRDMIAADKYLRSINAGKKKNRKAMMRSLFQRLSPPSARG